MRAPFILSQVPGYSSVPTTEGLDSQVVIWLLLSSAVPITQMGNTEALGAGQCIPWRIRAPIRGPPHLP